MNDRNVGARSSLIPHVIRVATVFWYSKRAVLKLRWLIALLSVTMGVASITAGLQFSDITVREILRNIGSVTQNMVHIRPHLVFSRATPSRDAPSYDEDGTSESLTSEDVETLLQTLPYVRAATPLSRTFLPVEISDVRAIPCAGVQPSFEEIAGARLVHGRFFAPLEDHRISRVGVIGTRLADKLFDGANPVGNALTVGGMPIRIIGVVAASEAAESLDITNTFFVPYSLFLELTTSRDIAGAIVMRIDTSLEREEVEQDIDRVLRAKHPSRNYDIWSGKEIVEKRQKLAFMVDWAIRGGASMTLIVACVACGAIMSLVVNERRREIGVRKAIGATSYSILLMFFAESAALMVVGGIIGVVMGFLVGTHMLGTVPQEMLPDAILSWENSVSIVVKAMQVVGVAAVISSIFPALRAARMDPALALHES